MTTFIFPFLQRFAKIVRGLQGQFFVDTCLCAGDSALLLTKHPPLIKHFLGEGRINRHTPCSAVVAPEKSVSIPNIPASCKTSYFPLLW